MLVAMPNNKFMTSCCLITIAIKKLINASFARGSINKNPLVSQNKLFLIPYKLRDGIKL
mgnify:CR=1 FL=1